jgi:multidrug efflux pump
VTAFGIFLTPVFYVVLRSLTGNRNLKRTGSGADATREPAEVS